MQRLAILLMMAGAPAAAQVLSELPEDQAVPPSIEAGINASLQSGEILDLVRRWQGDLVGDAEPDQVVQAAIAVGDGNAAFLRQWIFERRGDDYVALPPLDLPNGIKAARREGQDLVLTLYKALPEDPLCCPSAEEEVRVPLK